MTTYGQNHIETRTAIVEQTPKGPRTRYTLPENTTAERVQAYVDRVRKSGNLVVVQTFTVPR